MFNLPPSEYQTEFNQDIFALLMNRFMPGYFLEIGANDGFTLSNTVYLEKEFGWNGILVEANKKYMTSLTKRQKSLIVNKAVSFLTGEADFIDAGLYGGLKSHLDDKHFLQTNNASNIKVDCTNLQEILDMTGAPSRIDFISIDVEGGEVPVVEQMVSVKQRFHCGCIEYNGRVDDYTKITSLLEVAGYSVIWKGQTEQDLFFVDNIVPSFGCDPVRIHAN
jgi:FkbM family methyltransferase